MHLLPIAKLRNNIGFLFVTYILLFSSFAALLSTTVQLFFEYRRDIGTIEKTADQIGKSHIATIAQALWAYDAPILEMQLRGIKKLPDVNYAGIKKNNKIIIETDPKTIDKNFLSYEFPLLYEARKQQLKLGTLQVKMGLSAVYQRLWDRVVIILLTQALKTFFVSTFIFFLFYFIVGRHLNTMADFARSINLKNLGTPLTLKRKRKKGHDKDELGLVESAMNGMRENLVDEMTNVTISQDALKKSEERFKSLVTNIPGIVYRRKIAPVWKIDYISDLVKKISGYSPQDFLIGNVNFLQLVYQEDAAEMAKTVDTRVEMEEPFEVEYRILHKDGSLRHVMEKGKAIPNGEHQPLWIDGVILDITEKCEIEKQLRERDVLLHTIIENTTDAVFLKDVEGRYVIANTAAFEAIGKPESEVIGKTDFELFPSKSAEIIARTDSRAIAIGKAIIDEEKLETAYGETYWQTNKSPLMDSDNNLVGVVGISRNITQLKQIQKQNEELQRRLIQAQKIESIGKLAGGIAHDFNNILSSILGYTELALDEIQKSSTAHDSLQEVYAAGKRAKELVRQILAFARQSEETQKPVQVDAVIKEVFRFIRSTTPSTIEIRLNITSDSLIMGNTTELHQVMMNLCTNAAHAMEDIGGILDVRMKDILIDESADNKKIGLEYGNYLVISVSDTGVGISPDIIESIFEPYFTTKEVGKGTGMGLAMVQGIVENHGGKITVVSTLGKGATFTIYLPVTPKRGNERQYEPEQLQGGTERILFVDDEAPIAEMGSLMLSRLGYSVTCKTNSLEALELIRSDSKDFDLVITDMTMPHVTGDQLAVKMMKIRADIPVILCTGYSKKVSDKTVSEIGIKAFLYKPITKADLAKTVRKVLDER